MNDFLKKMIGDIFKILPLFEEENIGLKDHIDSVVIQLKGGMVTYPELGKNIKYISIINSINFLNNNDFDKRQCKREVLKSTNALTSILESWC